MDLQIKSVEPILVIRLEVKVGILPTFLTVTGGTFDLNDDTRSILVGVVAVSENRKPIWTRE